MESFVMTQKNESISEINTASLLAMSSERLSIINIITLPDEADYSYQDLLNVLLHAATSPTDSLESASNDLKSKIPTTKIPSVDTIFNYVKLNSIENILSLFRKINSHRIHLISKIS